MFMNTHLMNTRKKIVEPANDRKAALILTVAIRQMLSLIAPQHPMKPTKVITTPTIINKKNGVL